MHSDTRTTSPSTVRVSIITPVYNRHDYLAEAIESVLAQTISDWELIIIDDGSSTDETRHIALNYQKKDDRIIYLTQEHLGVSAARNHGISIAKGNYLAFLDSDDRYLPEGLETLIKTLELADENVVMAYGNFIKYFQDDKRFQPTRVKPPLPRPGLYFQFLIPGGNPVAPCACLLQKTALEESGGFDSKFDGIEDRELWSRLIRKHDITHVEKAVAIYRKHGNQITGNRFLWRLSSDRQSHHFFFSLPLTTWFPAAIDDSSQAKALDNLAMQLLKHADPPFDTVLHMLRLAQLKEPNYQRYEFLSRLDASVPQKLRDKYGCDERI